MRFFSDSVEDPLGDNNVGEEDDFIEEKRELEPQGVDPKRGWDFRGVHKVSINCIMIFQQQY